MTTFLEQAQIAAAQENWTDLERVLELWLSSGSAQASGGLASDFQRQVALNLALQVLTYGDFQSRWDAAKLLPAFGEGAIAPLSDLLHNDAMDLEVRWYAARILGQFAHPVAIQSLVAAVQADADEDLSRMAADALAALGTEAVAALTPLLESVATRSLVVSALAQIRSGATIAPLLTMVQDSQPNVRATALEALGSFHDARIPPQLVQALEDPAAAVRKVAIAGLGFRPDLVGELDLVRRLGDRLWDVDLTVGQQAAIALGRLGPTAAPTLRHALDTPHPSLPWQVSVVQALTWSDPTLALAYFRECLTGPPATPTLAQPSSPFAAALDLEMIRLLGRWTVPEQKRQATEVLLQLLPAPTLLVQRYSREQLVQYQAIALALGELGQSNVLDPLIRSLAIDDLGLRLHIIAALKRLDPSRARDRLLELSQHLETPAEVQRGIAIALQEW
jgi:HEAT repeat protein